MECLWSVDIVYRVRHTRDMTQNSTRHYEVIDADTNETIMVAKGRNSFGGFVKMQRRIAETLGATGKGWDLDPAVISGEADDIVWGIAGRTYRLAETNVL